MKKRQVIFINFLYISSLFSSESWLHIPFNVVGKEIQKFSASDCSRVFNNEHKRTLAVVGIQPTDIIKTIISKLLDDEKIKDNNLLFEIADKFIKMPIINAFEELKRTKDLFAYNDSLQTKSMGMFFGLSPQQQRRVVSINQLTWKDTFLHGEPGLLEEQCDELQSLDDDIYNHFVEDKKVTIISPWTNSRVCIRRLLYVSSIAMLILIPFYFKPSHNVHATTFEKTVTATSYIAVIMMGYLWLCITARFAHEDSNSVRLSKKLK